nr:hypothetical protein BaRGS_007462 [Batillaria attramentaria]
MNKMANGTVNGVANGNGPIVQNELLDIKKRHPDCKIIIGNTELGIETKFKKQLYPVLVAATHVRELSAVNRQESGIQFGASVTLATLDSTLKAAVKELPEEKTRVFAAFVEMLRWFAGHQIRNVAAIGGNIMTASPISDLNPLLLACGAVLDLGEFFYGYKQANRKEDDISIVNAGMRVVLDEKAAITDLSLAFGGMAPITVMATNTMIQLIGRLNTGARTKARARLVKVDPSAALAMPGVVDFVTHTDIPGSNSWGLHVKDDVVFAVDEVVHQGQPIGGILADTQVNAQRAAQAVVVEYDVTEPVITIADAIKKGTLYDYNPTIVCGDVDKAMAEADHVLEGEVHIEAQEHFYLEPHVAIAYPGEEDQIEVRCIAGVLGVQCNKVKTTVKRLGGGFGGKESRSAVVALPVAVAAVKHKSPVRCALERDEDMMMSGTRHPFLGKYKIGFSSDGKILAYDVTYYSNAGCSVDLSFAVREINLYKKGDATHYRQVLDECNLQRCWADVKTQSQFDTRRKQADDFNSKNRWRKRGLAITPNKFGFNYYDGFMNQLTSQVLQLPVSKITVNGASIDVVPNTSPSAASVSSDMFGGAVVILRTDIVFDVGKSINPAIDIGQIEGGFIQGIGEPPLLLATSVLSAIHDAIRAARKDEGLDLDFRLDTPATPARIRMACSDRFTKMFETEEENKAKPWFVDL